MAETMPVGPPPLISVHAMSMSLVTCACYVLSATGWAAEAFWGCASYTAWPRGFQGLATAANVTSQRTPIRKHTCPRTQSLCGFPSGASSGDPVLLFAPSGEDLMGVADSGVSLLPTLTGLQQSTQLFF